MNKANTQAAKTFGSIAFSNGLPCAPALCAEMRAMQAGREVGDKRTISELKAWIAGWAQTNLTSQAQ